MYIQKNNIYIKSFYDICMYNLIVYKSQVFTNIINFL